MTHIRSSVEPDINVGGLIKFCFSIGVRSSEVIPDQSVVPLNELERFEDRLVKTIKRE
jgi:hypothetical protein